MAYRTQQTYTTPLYFAAPVYEKINGVQTKTFPETKKYLFFASFKTFGGTERDVNGLYAIEDTAEVETWYRPDIKSDCRVITASGAVYEIINEPENIEMRNQTLKFKVRRIKGGV